MSSSDEPIKAARRGARPSLTVELIAGSIAGAAQVIVGQPLDTVKTRAQIAPSKPFRKSFAASLRELNYMLYYRRDVCELDISRVTSSVT